MTLVRIFLAFDLCKGSLLIGLAVILSCFDVAAKDFDHVLRLCVSAVIGDAA
jgi:hypothetical protein